MKNYLCAFLLFFFFSAVAHAQEMKVSGVVTSAEDGQPVIGATVTVKGNTAIGTVTDIDGNFQLMIPAGTDKIVVSYVGMKSQELTPSTRSMNIQLTGDTEVLEEVVVTGMQRQDKRLFTGATTQVDADKALIGGMTDISRSLEGRSAGVSVQNVSGTFGTAPKIRVRGATSIYGASKPLWVVDGVIMEDAVEIDADALSSGDATTLISSAIAGLNSDDIESFQILKDGSATSIYGARAMAGVIVVTTKKGKAGTRGWHQPHQLYRRVHHAHEAEVFRFQHHEFARPDVCLPRVERKRLPQHGGTFQCQHQRRVWQDVRLDQQQLFAQHGSGPQCLFA